MLEATKRIPRGAPYGDSPDGDSDVSPEQLRACSRQLASGVSVVTTRDIQGDPFGLTMSAVTCLSLKPALFLVCISEESDTLGPLLESGAFAINVLRRGQEELARGFAMKGGSAKFNQVDYVINPPAGLPVLQGALAVIECQLIAAYPGGDHRIMVGKVRSVRTSGGMPLVYHDGGYVDVCPGGGSDGISPVAHRSEECKCPIP